MKAKVEIKGLNTEISYILSDSSSEIISKVLMNDIYKNCLKVGYEFNLDGIKLKIVQVAAHEFCEEEVNGMNVLLTAYVEEIID